MDVKEKELKKMFKDAKDTLFMAEMTCKSTELLLELLQNKKDEEIAIAENTKQAAVRQLEEHKEALGAAFNKVMAELGNYLEQLKK